MCGEENCGGHSPLFVHGVRREYKPARMVCEWVRRFHEWLGMHKFLTNEDLTAKVNTWFKNLD